MKRGLLLATLLLVGSAAWAQPEQADASFAGEWETTFGPVKLEQTETRVSGSYMQGRATITGEVGGRRLTFRYAEPEVEGEGSFDLAADGESFTGRWREAGQTAWRTWAGKLRAKAKPRGAFDGVFEARVGRLRLIQDIGGPVRGTYEYSGKAGSLEGKVTGNKLSFQWTEGSTKGEGEYTLAKDGGGFTGRWRSGQGPWTPWNAKRVAAKPNVVWLVVLEAQWEKNLADREFSFGGMLRAYLRRYPHVQVRQRRFGDAPDFQREIRDLAFLAEPVVLVVASHGEQGKLLAEGEHIDATVLGPALNDARTVELVHFSSCEMMVKGVPEAIQAKVQGRRVPISGYSVSVDWSASALLELTYMDLVLGRRIAPAQAANVIRQELKFSSDTGTPGSPFGAAHFRFKD